MLALARLAARGPPPLRRAFSKYLPKARAKRLPLDAKRAGKGYAKGHGARSTGRRTSLGKFVVDAARAVRLVAPAPGPSRLGAYVARACPRIPYAAARGPGRAGS
jgi:large subunit ribosomal protein L41